MKKCLIRVRQEGLCERVVDLTSLLTVLSELEIGVPSWAIMTLIVTREDDECLDVAFFDQPTDFFIRYSKAIINGRGRVLNFVREVGKEWTTFVPPTLIGVNLRTTLRENI